jgi:CheY-like chemotaxis protein
LNGPVLLVDDNIPYLVALQDTLEPLGVEVVMAESGEEALRHILQRDFAIVIMDLMLTDMTGFEVCSLIRRRDRCRNLPIVIVTGLEENAAKELTGYLPGMFELLRKPAQPEVLRAKVVAACVARFQPAL